MNYQMWWLTLNPCRKFGGILDVRVGVGNTCPWAPMPIGYTEDGGAAHA